VYDIRNARRHGAAAHRAATGRWVAAFKRPYVAHRL